jgi:hypothetical protein
MKLKVQVVRLACCNLRCSARLLKGEAVAFKHLLDTRGGALRHFKTHITILCIGSPQSKKFVVESGV